MKNLMKLFKIMVIVFAFTFAVPSFVPAANNIVTVEAAKPRLNKTNLTITKGKTYTLKLKNNKSKIKWSTNAKKIATVNSNGKITAKKAGTAIITAKVGKKKYSCTVTINEPLGTKSNPISAYNFNTIKVYDVFGRKQTLDLQLKQCLVGAEAEAYVSFYSQTIPTEYKDYEWVYLEFYSERKTNCMLSNIMWYDNFYNATCTKQLYHDKYMILGMTDPGVLPSLTCVDPYSPKKTNFYVLVAVAKSDLPLTFNMATGYNAKTNKYTYTWYTTKK